MEGWRGHDCGASGSLQRPSRLRRSRSTFRARGTQTITETVSRDGVRSARRGRRRRRSAARTLCVSRSVRRDVRSERHHAARRRYADGHRSRHQRQRPRPDGLEPARRRADDRSVSTTRRRSPRRRSSIPVTSGRLGQRRRIRSRALVSTVLRRRTGSTNYVACGDGVAATAAVPPALRRAAGVSTGAVSGNDRRQRSHDVHVLRDSGGVVRGAQRRERHQHFAPRRAARPAGRRLRPRATLPRRLATRPTSCACSRTDALVNARCSDLASASEPHQLTASFTRGTFGVDKVAPLAAYVEPATSGLQRRHGCGEQRRARPTAASSPTSTSRSDSRQRVGLRATPITTLHHASCDWSGNGCRRRTRAAASTTPSAARSGVATVLAARPRRRRTSAVTRTASRTRTASFTPPRTRFGCSAGSAANGAASVTVTSRTPDRRSTLPVTRAITGTAAPTITAASITGASGYRQVVIDYVRRPSVVSRFRRRSLVVRARRSLRARSDNLDLIGTDYTLTYAITPAGGAGERSLIRAHWSGVGVAFDNVLTTSSSFSLVVPFFVRNIAS